MLVFLMTAQLPPQIAARSSGVEDYPQPDCIVARSGVSEAVDLKLCAVTVAPSNLANGDESYGKRHL